VSAKDSQLMNDIIGRIDEISAAKAEVEKKKKDQENVKKELSSLKKSLNSQMFEAQEAVEAIADKTGDAKNDLKKIQDAMDDYEREIARALAAAAERVGSKLVFGSVAFKWPAPGFYSISSPFGYRIHPITGKRSLHGGTDIAGSGISNTPAKAAADGTVLTAAWNSSYGYYVMVYHGRGSDGKEYATLYAHLWSYCVSEGDQVKAGQKLGNIGSTGSSTGPHLHFEIRIKDEGDDVYTRVDPMQFF
jgi:murein DD-endopeptidase MepM/ murein hydrolase activator NlpD